ncbi:NmrA family NAD(P)-binding protein [Streptomyces sp. G-G2]|uniref:NmrA family NAD(P)-binding protein n=1 Tax=Streptomyces sp. G-G2 TaxID=3046201 RepID=UPI0024B8D600|nr:NmrA family NAD(P)-binding protein [Streptomyces sp. G-G2]MDJ0382365.1 NmrA family NAD(P)-binding protein [Streptomyces sp. G-G2]
MEEHIRALGIPATILRPAVFMEDFTSPARFFQNGSLNVPWHDDLVMPLIAIDDIGAFAALAFGNPDAYLGRAIAIAGDRLTAPQITEALSAAAGRPVPHTQIPLDILWEHHPEVAKVYTWANSTFYASDPAPLRQAHPGVMDFRTWLSRSGKARLAARLDAAAG